MQTITFANKNTGQCLAELSATPEGLSETEAQERLRQHGPNEITTKKTTAWDILVRQFKSPFTYLLLFGGIITLSIGEKVDSLFIFSFILINTVLGFFQEFRAEKTIGYLKKYFPFQVKVLRQNKEILVEKKYLVAGDIVMLEAGNIVPADIRILEATGLMIDESIVSGESVPVAKTSDLIKEGQADNIIGLKNIALAGSSITHGTLKGLVVGTGNNTAIGEISQSASKTKRESAYEKEVLYFSKLILKIVVVTILFLYTTNLLIKGTENLFDFSLFAIALIVSILPEALPVVVTFALAKGALKMAKEKVVIRRLTAIEDLGNVEILCTDKTGTLTEGKLRLEEIISPNQQHCLLYSLLTAESFHKAKATFNPFDLAIMEKSDAEIKKSLEDFSPVSRIPFDSFRMIETAHVTDKNGQHILIAKGAPENILEKSSHIAGGKNPEQLLAAIRQEGGAGRRAIGIAYKHVPKVEKLDLDEKDFTFLGYLVFSDPLKPSADDSIILAEKLGVRFKIITGDSPEVAHYVAVATKMIKKEDGVISGNNLSQLDDFHFDKACQDFDVFARIDPDMKLRIIKSLQKKYEVGFLGEGINDAPALKAADVGIVVANASDVAREVSDIVLMEKNLKVIVNGIQIGRSIFANINKYIKCTLASNFGNFYSIAIISLFIDFLPMLPVQILLANILSDFPLISIATDKIDNEEARKPKTSRLQNSLLLIIYLALVSTVFDFIFFAIFYKSEPATMQTLWMVESVLTEIVLVFILRTRHFFLKANRPSFQLLFFTILILVLTVALPFSKFGQAVFHFSLPSTGNIMLVLGLILAYFVSSEIVKLVYYRIKNRELIKA